MMVVVDFSPSFWVGLGLIGAMCAVLALLEAAEERRRKAEMERLDRLYLGDKGAR
jgi:hypothetical protein